MTTRFRSTRVLSACAFLLAFSVLYSCKHEEEQITPTPIPENPPPQPPPPGNELPGDPCGTSLTTGYTDKVSYAAHEQVTAFLHGSRTMDLCRLDVYDINGHIAFSVPSPLTVQQITTGAPSTDGFGYSPTIKFQIPAHVKSGVYLIENKISFIVRPSSPVDLLIVYPSNTANAYNESGGKSLYSPSGRPSMVSFHRPMALQSFSTVCLTWLTTLSSYEIGYIADIDLDDYTTMSRGKLLVLVGHNEYWTRLGRQNFDKFVDTGGDALILSGNTMWWQVRYSDDKTGLICYKDGVADPIGDPLLKTIEWDKPALNYSILSSIGADFPHGGYGLKADNGWNGFKVMTPDSPLLEGQGLTKGSIISCPSSEYDGTPVKNLDANGYPVLDMNALDVEKIEVVAFDRGFRVTETYCTFIVMQKTKTSGIIINTGTTDWCSANGMGGASAPKIKGITLNAINKLLNGQNVFAP